MVFQPRVIQGGPPVETSPEELFFLECAAEARKNPERFKRLVLVHQSVNEKDRSTVTEIQFTYNMATVEIIGVLQMGILETHTLSKTAWMEGE